VTGCCEHCTEPVGFQNPGNFWLGEELLAFDKGFCFIIIIIIIIIITVIIITINTS